MENYIWSLDISTTNIGSALWNYEGKLIELKHLALRIKKDVPEEFRDLTKADFANTVKNFINCTDSVNRFKLSFLLIIFNQRFSLTAIDFKPVFDHFSGIVNAALIFGSFKEAGNYLFITKVYFSFIATSYYIANMPAHSCCVT